MSQTFRARVVRPDRRSISVVQQRARLSNALTGIIDPSQVVRTVRERQ